MTRKCPRCRKPIVPQREPTKPEGAWMRRLERVLMDAPDGIGLLTIGDRELRVYDRARAEEHGIEHTYDGGAYTHGLVIGTVSSAVGIEGVSG